jgi:hypothetical protein
MLGYSADEVVELAFKVDLPRVGDDGEAGVAGPRRPAPLVELSRLLDRRVPYLKNSVKTVLKQRESA